MADVAREASVSKATVSMALRGMPEISETTRKRVAEVAGQLGYRADPCLSRIAASRWKERSAGAGDVVAFMEFAPCATDDSRSGAYETGARQRAAQLGYGFSRHRVSTVREMLQRTRILYHRGVQCVILASVSDPAFIDAFPWDRFTVAGVGDHVCEPPTDSIRDDVFSAVSIATEKILASGHRRIGLILPDDAARRTRNIVGRGVFEATVREAGAPVLPPFYLGASEIAFGLSRWLRDRKPEAILGYSDHVLDQIASVGGTASADLAFASLQTEKSTSEVAGMVDSSAELGARSAELVDELLRRGIHGRIMQRSTRLLASIWKDGKSLPQLMRSGRSARAREPLLAVS